MYAQELFKKSLQILHEIVEQSPSPAIQQAARELFWNLKAGYRNDQARVPSGNRDGGRWVAVSGGNGGAGKPKPTRKLDPATHKRSTAIYGETSGLTPKLKDPKKSPYTPSNWEPDSANRLQTARTYIGIVSVRNPRVHYATPSRPSNPIQAQVWERSVNAAINSQDATQLDVRVNHFFLRQDGIGRQTPPWPELERIYSLGPFNNVGGGDVPKGPNTYIDFYGKPLRR